MAESARKRKPTGAELEAEKKRQRKVATREDLAKLAAVATEAMAAAPVRVAVPVPAFPPLTSSPCRAVQAATLEALNLTNIREVVDMSDEAVKAKIQRMMLDVLHSIMAGQGYEVGPGGRGPNTEAKRGAL